MKKFRFRLERVLQYRQVVRQEKKRELALKIAQLREAEKRMEELRQAQIANALPESRAVNLDEFMLRGRYAARLKEDIEKQQEVMAIAQRQVEEAREVYVEAAKEAKTLEMLKEKRKTEYEEYQNKEEDKILDEMATQRSNFNI